MLLTGKNWRLSASQKVADADTLLNVLLKNRGITEGQSVEQFLSEDDGIWYDPFLYNDMRKAVDIINETMDRHGKILVYGDYDCDGVTATSILVRYFRSHSVNVCYIVPHRSEHGYGLTEKIMDKVIEKKPDLVITVDCGVTNVDTVQELKNRGIKVIVTDHHNVKDELPPADCVICAKRPDNTYPFIDLCGAGVALKLVEALGKDGRYKVTGNIWRQTVELVEPDGRLGSHHEDALVVRRFGRRLQGRLDTDDRHAGMLAAQRFGRHARRRVARDDDGLRAGVEHALGNQPRPVHHPFRRLVAIRRVCGIAVEYETLVRQQPYRFPQYADAAHAAVKHPNRGLPVHLVHIALISRACIHCTAAFQSSAC